MTSLASRAPKTPRPLSRSGSMVIKPQPQLTVVEGAISTPLREGYIMFYDTPTAEWQRVFLTMANGVLTTQSTSARFGKLVRPPTALSSISHFYCSLEVEDAPDRHIPVLGIRTEKDELFIFRTPERKSLAEWCFHLKDACPHCPWDTVEAMSTMRIHFSPQLYGTLFRPDLAAKGLVRSSVAAPPQRVSNIPLPARRSSLSAGCPRRAGPIRRTAAKASHADANAASGDALIDISNVATFSPQPSLTPLGMGATNVPLRPDAKKVAISTLLAGPRASQSRGIDNNENISPLAGKSPSSATIVSVAASVPLQQLNNAAPVKQLADQGPTALEKQLQAKVKELKAQCDESTGRNMDLEIDNANICARVLELEGEVTSLKDGVAEWRRRYASLEQQLACQDEGFKTKLVADRAELVANMKEEVEAQFAGLKERFATRERELEAKIVELTNMSSTSH